MKGKKNANISKFKVETKSIIGNDTSASTGNKTSTIK